MRKTYGYGVTIRNTPIDERKTVAYQDLAQIGYGGDGDFYIDVVRADSPKRPALESLIAKCNPGDRIDLYSIDTLLMGNNDLAVYYYSEILRKDIDLLAYDFSGAIAKISPSSTLRLARGDKSAGLLEKNEFPKDGLTQFFQQLTLKATSQKSSGGIKTEQRLEMSDAFKEIYFAYESYQIDQKQTLQLLSEYLGIENKITFWLMAKDFENNLGYADDLFQQGPEILELPKRCGGIPQEYYQILDYIRFHPVEKKTWEEQVKNAMTCLNMIGSYQVFHRWELLENKVPKPRKPQIIDFNINEFCEKYSKM